MRKNARLAASVLVLLIAAGAFFLVRETQNSGRPASACGFRYDQTVTVGVHKLQAEVASTNAARQKGLSGRSCIGQNEAMLFTFSQPGNYYFWMKDMKFPIDIIWISAQHKTVGVERDVEPSTYPDQFVNKDAPAQYVLELASQRSRSLDINLGTTINF